MEHPKPVRPGEVCRLRIEDLAHEGEGVGRCAGLAVFIPLALPGDLAEVQIQEVRRHYARGRLLRLVEPSPERVKPPCPSWPRCGGCQLPHLDYRAQLDRKRRLVEAALRRLGHLEEVPVRETLGMDEPWFYRNKAQFPVRGRPGHLEMGFFARGTHQVVPIDQCRIHHPLISRTLQVVKPLLEEYRVPPYDEESGRGLLRHVAVRVGFRTGEVLLTFVTAASSFPPGPEVAERLRAALPEVVGVAQNVNPRRTNVIFGPETFLLAGRGYILEELCGVRFRISPTSFFQVNPRQAEVLYARVARYAGLAEEREAGGANPVPEAPTLLDLYSGIGSIALCLAGRAGRVIGVEEAEEAVRDARENARLNGIANAEFRCGPVEEVLPRLAAEGLRPDIAVLDPPRSGCSPQVLDTVAELAAPRLVYVSCHPATLARDLARLRQRGYQAVEVQPVDMFPQTSHVEAVALCCL
ncbi:MAG: 23S rRNA (uracil(1939)-C(5))-methyltransferase RlmD [Bacillota bacterium]|nr:23S rRNA (uracil(1939)-C(5))-methyltransferase RlmD [Bacillota bacterium]